MPKPDKGPEPIKVSCPECDAEVTLDADGEGQCSACGLPVGGIMKRRRIERALERLREREADERKKADKGKGWKGLLD